MDGSDLLARRSTREMRKREKPKYPKQLPGKLGTWFPWYNCFYLLDYLMIIIIAIGLICLGAWKPTKSFSDTLDRLPPDVVLEYYNYPNDDELWAHGREYAIYIGVPIVTIIISQIWVLSLHDFHNAILGYIQSWVMASFFVEFFKRIFGYLRPDYLERVSEIDDEDDSEFIDARMSFPSGHATSAMATLFFLTLYLLGKLRPFDEEFGDGFLFQFVIVIAPTFLGIYVSATRIVEHQHFFEDVIVGWAIGIFFAFTSYCLVFYPPIWHLLDGRPKPKRSRNVQSVSRFYILIKLTN